MNRIFSMVEGKVTIKYIMFLSFYFVFCAYKVMSETKG